MHLFSFIPLALLLQQSIAFNSEENALQLNFEDECSMMVCRAGRECQLSGNGEASCVCMASCPDHFVPVCGSNGRSYDNYCMMHRDACLSGIHISLRSSGYCSDEKTSTIDDESLFEPVVCFQWERDALRRQILSHFRQHTIDGSWYSKPGGYNKHEKLRARFNKCDTSDDTFVDANELAACVADVPFALRTTQTSNKLVKFVYFRLVSIIISIISEILYVVFSKVHHFIFLFICLKNSWIFVSSPFDFFFFSFYE